MKVRKVDVTDNILFLELLRFPFSRVFQAPLGENLKSAFTFRDSLDGKASKSPVRKLGGRYAEIT